MPSLNDALSNASSSPDPLGHSTPSSKRKRLPNGYAKSPSSRASSSPSRDDHMHSPAHSEQQSGSEDPLEHGGVRLDNRDELSFLEQLEQARHEDSDRSHSPSRVDSPPARVSPAPQKPTELHYKPKLILKGHKKGVSAVKYSPDGRRIASCSADGTIRIWDAATGKHEHTLEGHLAGISTIAWSPDSTLLASGSDDKSIRLWHVATGKQHPVPFLGHHNYIYSIAISPRGNILVSGSYDEAVFLWDIRTARVMRSLPAHSDPVSGVDFVRDGTLIVSCAGDGLIRVWDTATGQCLRTIVHEDNAPVVSVRFSPNGKYVLAWTLDSCLRLWNYVDGRCVKTYQGHRNERFSIGGAFGVYGREMAGGGGGGDAGAPYAFIVSGSEDGSLLLWDVSSKQVLQRLQGHGDVVLGVDTHPTEPAIVSGGLDRTVRIWRLDESPRREVVEDAMETVEDAMDQVFGGDKAALPEEMDVDE